MKKYKVWDKSYYDSMHQYFPRSNQFFGEYIVKNVADLKQQLVTNGYSLKDCRWEQRPLHDA